MTARGYRARPTAARHTYFNTCPLCGAHLDPGERCDCSSGPENKTNTQKKEATNEQQH